ncbi:DUF523 domain-containing protein [Anaeromassilibacillus senegalensis]|uniref:DUF523 domain-containing protein n=1 Tax=Anaeromassilibacillus senegalensis TaxID=1673717 RepID=A0ABS9CLS1_9FIRM|nr:DUF523 domain-containing protein [Anaeromassilibacillus senegalensis]MCF2652076.1 DUF523 domain-containing protein [Anaeromassilibacillus senegalensis]
MAVILVSSCLLGCACRYKGDDCKNEKILKLAKEHVLLGVCPEQMGGLETPRDPSEIVGDKVLSCAGRDVTAQYQKGAEAALYLAKLNHVDFAILKAKSPSCGKELIYDGTFTGNKVPGNGVTVSLLLENGIPVYTEDELDQLPL